MDRGFVQSKPKRQLRGFLRSTAFLFFLIGMISGCGQRGESQNVLASTAVSASPALVGQKTNPSWLTGCPSCSQMIEPRTIIRHLQSVNEDQTLLMSFALVVDSGVTEFDFTNPKIASQYFGRATLLGRWRVTQVAEATLCGAPVGDYLIRPLTPSYMTSGVISGGTYEAVGPVRLVFRLQSSMVTEGDRLTLNAMVDTLHNGPCGLTLIGN